MTAAEAEGAKSARATIASPIARMLRKPFARGEVTDMHDLACVVHLHSLYSDGTGTVPEIARAAGVAGADVVLLTDHDTLEARRRDEEGWHDGVLVLVGEEVSPPGRNHYLAFGIE